MGKVSLIGTNNTVYVTTPDTITITPSNINTYYTASNFTPTVTVKNAPSSSATRYLICSAYSGNSISVLQGWKIKFTKGSKSVSVSEINLDPYDYERQHLGEIAWEKIEWGETYNRFEVMEVDSLTDETFEITSSAACSYKFSGFNPNTVTMIGSATSTINAQFGIVKGFYKATFNATAISKWNYSQVGIGTEEIAPSTTLKTSAGGVNGNTSTGTGVRSSTVTTGIVNATSITGTATATNTLGGSVTKPATVSAQDYKNPQLSNVKVERSGTDAVMTLDWSVAGVNKSSTVTQSVTAGTVKVDWTATANTEGAPTWSGTEIIAADGSAMSAITDTLPITDSTHTYDTETSYTFTVTLTDRLGQSATVSVILPTEFYTIDFKAGGRGVAIGKAADKDAFECAMDPFFIKWAGFVEMFAGITPPNGWLLCNGASKLIADYPELAAALYDSATSSYIYGSADSTHFNLPDFRGKFPLGVSSTHPITGTGSSGGSEYLQDHAHSGSYTRPTVSSSGAVTDGITGGSHSHNTYYTTANRGSGNTSTRCGPYGSNYTAITTNSTTHTHNLPNHTHTLTGGGYTVNGVQTTAHGTMTTGNAGNMPPYRTVNFIICAGRETV